MSQKEIRNKIIVTVFDLEEKFEEVSHIFRDLARLLMRLKLEED